MPGISNGAIVIKDEQGNQLISEIISGGKFYTKKVLQKPGYYSMAITGDLEKDYSKDYYDVYLEGGEYTITESKDSLYAYPVIKTGSKIQNELSQYYIPANDAVHAVKAKQQTINALLNDKDSPVAAAGNATELSGELAKSAAEMDEAQAQALTDYVSKYPQNDVAAHILSQIDYKKSPAAYYAAYQKFSAEQKHTDDGKAEGSDLEDLVKMAPGAVAPVLVGKTPDGRNFDPASIDKKIIMVEFWRSDNAASRANHHRLLTDYYSPLTNKKFTVVSVCLDRNHDSWIEAIKKDNVNWTQLNDLKGESSPNITNWVVTAIPTYDLVDGEWHIIKRDVNFNDIPSEVAKYLKMALTSRQQ